MNELLARTNRLPEAGAGFAWRVRHPTLALHPDSDHVRAAFTTRIGGGSPPPLHSLNVSWTIARRLGQAGDRPDGIDDVVLGNREIAARTVVGDWPKQRAETWSLVRQVHGPDVVEASRGYADADGLWTDDPERIIAVLVADCVPVLLSAPGRAGVAHAGWRGLLAGVVPNAAAALGATEVWAGPAIGPCCFEVGAEVVQAFRDRYGEAPVADERHVDLWVAVELAAREAGVAEVHSARVCTSCHPELFFSHRRDGGRTGRQALVAVTT